MILIWGLVWRCLVPYRFKPNLGAELWFQGTCAFSWRLRKIRPEACACRRVDSQSTLQKPGWWVSQRQWLCRFHSLRKRHLSHDGSAGCRTCTERSSSTTMLMQHLNRIFDERMWECPTKLDKFNEKLVPISTVAAARMLPRVHMFEGEKATSNSHTTKGMLEKVWQRPFRFALPRVTQDSWQEQTIVRYVARAVKIMSMMWHVTRYTTHSWHVEQRCLQRGCTCACACIVLPTIPTRCFGVEVYTFV